MFAVEAGLFGRLRGLPVPFFSGQRRKRLVDEMAGSVRGIDSALGDSIVRIFSDLLALVNAISIVL